MRQEFNLPVWTKHWKIFVLFSVICFAFAFGLRAVEYSKWANPEFSVDGEYIMGTHDAYYWLSGAKGLGSAVNNPMSGMLRILGSVTEAQYGNIAFWLPAIFAGFTAIAAFAWGMLVGGPWVGLVSSIYATSIPPFFFRTRLAYYDSDIITLLFPLTISVLLARWLSLGMQKSWFGPSKHQKKIAPILANYSLPVLAGIFVYYGKNWHPDVMTFGLVSFFISLFLAFLSDKENQITLLQGVCLFSLTAFAGIYGLIVCIIIYIYCKNGKYKSNKYVSSPIFWLLTALAIFSVSGTGSDVFLNIYSKIYAYLKPIAETTNSTSNLLYPGIAQSVIEAQNVNLDQLLITFAGNKILGYASLIAFLFALAMNRSIMLLAPFAALTVSTIWMGGRFSMFGGVAAGIGLALTAQWITLKITSNKQKQTYASAFASIAICSILLINIIPNATATPVTPILKSQHVKALKVSAKHIPASSTVWTWWDWGYATMYYTGAISYANGGHHNGKVLFPLGLAFATPSYMQSNQLIKFCAANNNHPKTVWDKMEPRKAEQLIQSLGMNKYDFNLKTKQYIVASWSDIRLAYWILYYGSWSLNNGGGIHPSVMQLRNQFSLDYTSGKFLEKGKKPLNLSSYCLLDEKGSTVKNFTNAIGPHLIFNKQESSGFLIDDFTFSSMLIRLLVENPEEPSLAKNFSLIYEGFPYVRVYEVI